MLRFGRHPLPTLVVPEQDLGVTSQDAWPTWPLANAGDVITTPLQNALKGLPAKAEGRTG
ncbi:hypothetical protein [Streptomyces sp. NPDC056690]|uniref:hypothetical protein n=1 Tax=unclassified Streptomyces TaxID=2593676 RepID=UPI00362A6F53